MDIIQVYANAAGGISLAFIIINVLLYISRPSLTCGCQCGFVFRVAVLIFCFFLADRL